MAKEIVDEILDNLNAGNEAHGMIFLKDISDAYEIGTKTIEIISQVTYEG